MTRYFAGGDVGSTKTNIIIADEHGRVLGLGTSGGGNHEGVGYAGLQHVVGSALQQALAQSGIAPSAIEGAGIGIGGYDWPAQHADHLHALAAAGMQMPLEIVNDAVVGLVAGAACGWGVGVVAGTSCNCWGIDAAGKLGRVVGEGHRVGEYGGASELAARAVQAVAYEWVLRGPPTLLSTEFMRITGAPDLAALIEGLTTGRFEIDAQHAPLIFQVALQGDVVARECIAWAGRELAALALCVIRQLQLQQLEFDVVLIGSLHKGGALLTDAMRTALAPEAPRARLVPLNSPPATGGVLLALRAAGLDAGAARAQLMQSAAAFVSQP